MKKLYTILLAASVAISASAAPLALKTSLEEQNFTTEKSFAGVPNLAKFKKSTTALSGNYEAHNTTAVKKAPAKAAPTKIDDILGVYNLTGYSYGLKQEFKSITTIKAGEKENEVILDGFRYVDVSCTATVDLAAGTLTIAPQMVLDLSEPDDPWAIWLTAGAVTADNHLSFDAEGSIVFNINDDGTLSTKDFGAFVVNKTTLNDFFEDLAFTPNTEVNSLIEYSERDDDGQNYLDTFTEYMTYAKVEYVPDLTVGGENLGECVILSNFIFSENAVITKTYNIIIQIEHDPDGIFIDNWYWFDYSIPGEAGKDPDEGTAAIVGVVGNKITFIEGTFTEDTISWEQEWGAYDNGFFGWFKGCTIHLPFKLNDGNSGIADITADNENAPVEYFNLQGMRISEPAAGQIVIRRQGTKTTKMLVK